MHDDEILDDVEQASAVKPETRIKSPAKKFKLETFFSLRHRNYRYLWSGTLLMGAGQWIQQVTLGWLLYD